MRNKDFFKKLKEELLKEVPAIIVSLPIIAVTLLEGQKISFV